MVCNSCGRTSGNENANFCDYCGASLKGKDTYVAVENAYSGESQADVSKDSYSNTFSYSSGNVESQGNSQAPRTVYGGNYVPNTEDGNEKPVSFWNFLGSMLIPFIPIVGPIVYLVMLLVWSFGSDTNPSKKNWARAMLVFGIICFAIAIIFIIYISMMILNSGGMESFMNEYYGQGLYQ